MNVNSSSNLCIADCSRVSELSYKLLQGFNVAVVKYRCYEFAFLFIRPRNAYVLLEFPFSALIIPSRLSAVAVSVRCVFVSACSEKLCRNFRRLVSCDVVHLNLNPDGLCLCSFNLLSDFLFHDIVSFLIVGLCLCCFVVHILPSFRDYINTITTQIYTQYIVYKYTLCNSLNCILYLDLLGIIYPEQHIQAGTIIPFY